MTQDNETPTPQNSFSITTDTKKHLSTATADCLPTTPKNPLQRDEQDTRIDHVILSDNKDKDETYDIVHLSHGNLEESEETPDVETFLDDNGNEYTKLVIDYDQDSGISVDMELPSAILVINQAMRDYAASICGASQKEYLDVIAKVLETDRDWESFMNPTI